ncbi:MAG TPA: polysaccharide deacetylase family protein [Paenalcaligenes hominis]|uniref:Polysaccharide deacetylase family protein n=1 Tax=Paenalcaligenes hominis TaxID=643674 RepID=A0A9D3ABC7_9BURK|nr:polysaccharide deacetylase family protein [Paenalcaligenes hominis]
MIPILMYHQIAVPPPKGTRLRGSTVHPIRFARQMQWLKRLGYTGLSLAELEPYVLGQKTGRVVGITFDDGYQNVYDNALPVLKKLGFSSTNFIVSGEIAGQNTWAQRAGSPSADLMDERSILRWVDAGQEIGSHTVSHERLAELDDNEVQVQLQRSKSDLEQLIQTEVQSFCYPYGSVSTAVKAQVAALGYKRAVTTERGLAHAHDDVYALPRVTVLRSTHLVHFLRKVVTQYENRKRTGKD